MEKAISKIVAIGIPTIVFTIATATTKAMGCKGATVITKALASIGPGGMRGGLLCLGIIGLGAQVSVEYGTKAIIKSVVKESLKSQSSEEIKSGVDKMLISKSLKLEIKNYIDKKIMSQQSEPTEITPKTIESFENEL